MLNIYYTDSGKESYGISALAQLNQSLLVYTDSRNHCLRKLEGRTIEGNRSWVNSTFAGRCFEPGDVDGLKELGRLWQPLECKHYRDYIFVTDNLFKIKRINVFNGTITTVYESLQRNELQFLEIGHFPNEFYVTTNHGVLRIKHGREYWLVGSRAPMNTLELDPINFNKPKKIVWLSNDTLLVADAFTNTLTKIDVNSDRNELVCYGMYALNMHTG